MMRTCTHDGCEAVLGHRNRFGLCRDHYRSAPEPDRQKLRAAARARMRDLIHAHHRPYTCCVEGCSARVTRSSKSGMCSACAGAATLRRYRSDPKNNPLAALNRDELADYKAFRSKRFLRDEALLAIGREDLVRP